MIMYDTDNVNVKETISIKTPIDRSLLAEEQMQNKIGFWHKCFFLSHTKIPNSKTVVFHLA